MFSQVILFTKLQVCSKFFARGWPPTQSETRTRRMRSRNLISTWACAARFTNAMNSLSWYPFTGFSGASTGRNCLCLYGNQMVKPMRQPPIANLVKIWLYWLRCNGGATEPVRRTESQRQSARHILKLKQQHQQRLRPVFLANCQGATKWTE